MLGVDAVHSRGLPSEDYRNTQHSPASTGPRIALPLGDKDKAKLKSLCYRCHVNKWIVDFKEGCAANISSISVCLAASRLKKLAS